MITHFFNAPFSRSSSLQAETKGEFSPKREGKTSGQEIVTRPKINNLQSNSGGIKK
jgi:hypothetical protein